MASGENVFVDRLERFQPGQSRTPLSPQQLASSHLANDITDLTADVTSNLTLDVVSDVNDSGTTGGGAGGEMNYVASGRSACSEGGALGEVSEAHINGHHCVRFQAQPGAASPGGAAREADRLNANTEEQAWGPGGRVQDPEAARSYSSPGSMIRAQALEALQQPRAPREAPAPDGTGSNDLAALTREVLAPAATDSLPLAPAPAPVVPIAVERKFSLAPDTEGRLGVLGARLLWSARQVDAYWDTEELDLTRAGWALRQRQDRWELRLPDPDARPGRLSVPHRVENHEPTMAALLTGKLSKQLTSFALVKPTCVTDVVVFAGLTSLATLTSHKRRFGLPDCTVDIEITEDFQVGEIEVLAAGPDRVPQALNTMEAWAAQLGMSPLCLNAIEV